MLSNQNCLPMASTSYNADKHTANKCYVNTHSVDIKAPETASNTSATHIDTRAELLEAILMPLSKRSNR